MGHIWMKKLYKNKTYLYNKGDECLNITGGWSEGRVNGISNYFIYKSPIINTDYISLYDGPREYTNYATLGKIDVTLYRYIKINVTNFQFTSSGYRSILFYKERNNLSGSINVLAISGTGVNFVNIRQITGEYYIGVLADHNADSGSSIIDFNKIWFET